MSLLRSWQWLRAEMWALAGFHLALGLVIGFAPERLVVTPGSIEAFRILPNVVTVDSARILWAVLFSLAAVLIVALSLRVTLIMQHITWVTATFADGLWAVAFAAPLLMGRGAAASSVIFPALLAWSFFVMARVAHGTGG